ncbi:MAG TPA: TadE family protein [Actinomycetota bacterium]|nr:TadE family protein [Actinomycetota bacterium]
MRNERGASAVEFAIVVSLLFMVLFGTVQFGMAYNRSQGLQAGAREGARLAAIGATFSEIQQRVRLAQSLFVEGDVVVTTAPASSGSGRPCATAGIGGLVTVTATVPPSSAYAIAIPIYGQRQITYTGTGTFRCERTNT